MIPKEVYGYSKEQLIDWLRNEAGSSNPDYFNAKKTGGLKLQQVPEEYASLLLYLKDRNINTYLSLGIGNGGSFAVECFFLQQSLDYAIAVDDLSYGNLIGQNETEVISMIEQSDSEVEIAFVNSKTDTFFKSNKDKFDSIFIDADHSYEGAKKDYDNALNHINEYGIIIFHDIVSEACPGIRRLWSEVKQGRVNHEFIASKTCGIGVIEL